jgi:hypothetical protein
VDAAGPAFPFVAEGIVEGDDWSLPDWVRPKPPGRWAISPPCISKSVPCPAEPTKVSFRETASVSAFCTIRRFYLSIGTFWHPFDLAQKSARILAATIAYQFWRLPGACNAGALAFAEILFWQHPTTTEA